MRLIQHCSNSFATLLRFYWFAHTIALLTICPIDNTSFGHEVTRPFAPNSAHGLPRLLAHVWYVCARSSSHPTHGSCSIATTVATRANKNFILSTNQFGGGLYTFLKIFHTTKQRQTDKETFCILSKFESSNTETPLTNVITETPLANPLALTTDGPKTLTTSIRAMNNATRNLAQTFAPTSTN